MKDEDKKRVNPDIAEAEARAKEAGDKFVNYDTGAPAAPNAREMVEAAYADAPEGTKTVLDVDYNENEDTERATTGETSVAAKRQDEEVALKKGLLDPKDAKFHDTRAKVDEPKAEGYKSDGSDADLIYGKDAPAIKERNKTVEKNKAEKDENKAAKRDDC